MPPPDRDPSDREQRGQRPPLYSKEQAVRILMECILVNLKITFFTIRGSYIQQEVGGWRSSLGSNCRDGYLQRIQRFLRKHYPR